MPFFFCVALLKEIASRKAKIFQSPATFKEERLFLRCENGEHIIYRTTNRGAAGSFAQVKRAAWLGRTPGDSYLTGNQISDSDGLFTHLLSDKDTAIQHGQLWPGCGLIKYAQWPNCTEGVEFSETNSKAALPERQAGLLKREMKGLKRRGVTPSSLVGMPQNTVNVQPTALTRAPPAPWRAGFYL